MDEERRAVETPEDSRELKFFRTLLIVCIISGIAWTVRVDSTPGVAVLSWILYTIVLTLFLTLYNE